MALLDLNLEKTRLSHDEDRTAISMLRRIESWLSAWIVVHDRALDLDVDLETPILILVGGSSDVLSFHRGLFA